MSEALHKREETTEQKAVQYPFAVAVRFRGAGKPYTFGSYKNDYKKGEWVVVETQQGIEMGQCDADSLSVEKYGLHMPGKPVIRRATENDHANFERNLEEEKEAFRICCNEINEFDLDMHLLSARYTLDRSKILFVYLADQRVDFRELLKKLGSTLHCRIELRQIGERDKAKMVGGIGMCGMECCCRRFKNHFDVISINMAKNQLLALNIDKLSGMCGKLKCCLKYEDDYYKELTKDLPKMGSQVEYDGEIYRITNMNVMSEEAKLENRETAIFITLKDLREKAIPRKGVVMKKKDDGDKPVRKTVIHANKPAPVKKEDRVMAAPAAAEVRTFVRKKDKPENKSETKQASANKQNSSRRHNNQQNRNHKPVTENKNITVRTFGRKKNEEKK